MGYLAYVIPIDGQGGRPDQGLPPGYGGRPDQGLPGYGHPDHGLPGGGGHPSQGLPGQPLPPHISNRPPGSGGGHPEQGLPGMPTYPSTGPVPPTGTPHGVAAATAPPSSVDTTNGAWVLVALGNGVVVWAWAQPQNVSGGGGGSPDNTLPGGTPPTAGQPLPPTAQPKK